MYSHYTMYLIKTGKIFMKTVKKKPFFNLKYTFLFLQFQLSDVSF